MSPQIGGSVTSISFNGRQFSVPADSDFSDKLGGTENETLANGDRTARLIKTIVPWNIGGVVVAIDDSQQDYEFLNDLKDSNEFSDIAVELASGAIWTGQGTINGELTRSTQTATATFDLGGPGKLTQQ